MKAVLRRLAEAYPQLYLNPDADAADAYRQIVLRGGEPERKTLDHYLGDERDADETADTPAGPVRVVTLGNRRDFERVLRSLLAAKNGPLAPVPASQGAATVTVFSWPRIRAHLARFPAEEQAAEFRRFTAVRENYQELLVLLSRGPYSGVDAAAVGLGEEEWLTHSDKIRRFHELTHVVCRRRNPGEADAVRDELIADAVGLYAAFGRFDPALEKRFLGIRGDRYVGGRLENYTDAPEKHVEGISAALDRIEKHVEAQAGAEPLELIPALMKLFEHN